METFTTWFSLVRSCSLLRKAQSRHLVLSVRGLSCDAGLCTSVLPPILPEGEWLCRARAWSLLRLEAAWRWFRSSDSIYAPPQVSTATDTSGAPRKCGKLLPTSSILCRGKGFSHTLISSPFTLCWGGGRACDPKSRGRGPGTSPWRPVTHQSLWKYL